MKLKEELFKIIQDKGLSSKSTINKVLEHNLSEIEFLINKTDEEKKSAVDINRGYKAIRQYLSDCRDELKLKESFNDNDVLEKNLAQLVQKEVLKSINQILEYKNISLTPKTNNNEDMAIMKLITVLNKNFEKLLDEENNKKKVKRIRI